MAERHFSRSFPESSTWQFTSCYQRLDRSNEVSVEVKSQQQPAVRISDCSDGLSGELYGEQGWIARFSKE